MNSLKSTLFLVLSLFFTSYASAQLASVQNGCAPLTVEFNASGNPTSFFWTLGDGNTSLEPSPTYIYQNPGTYVIQFRLVAGGPVLATDTVRVFNKPTISLAADPTSGCIPLDVQFTGSVNVDPGIDITGYSWAFGDGSSDLTVNPITSHTYNQPNSFTVGLELESSFENCNVFVQGVDLIETSPQPNPRFTTDPFPPTSCEAPFTVTFTNNTNGTNLNYNWDFGNGETSNLENPDSVTYNANGNYIVSLVATNSLGCSDTIRAQVTIGPPFADFMVPDTVCAGERVRFENNSSVGIYLWNFGTGADPEQSGDTNPSVVFNTEGNQTIQLSVADPTNTCLSDTSKTIYVDAVDATFTSDPSYSCNLPQEFTFTPVSSEPDSFVWIFPDITESNERIGMYSHPRDTSTYGKNGFQLLLTTLTVYNDRGCKGYFEKRDTICPPNALFETDTTMGCAPLAVEFTSQSTSCDDIVSWTYVWGDGTENTFLDEGPHTHTYNQDGDFLAYLIVVNERGCRDTSYEIPIEVGVPIDPDFNMDLNTICTGDTLRVSDITGDPRIDAWHFTADGARLEQCPGEPNTNLVFVDASGQIEINLEVIYNGCPASNSQTHTIDVSGPQARYAYSIDCASPMQVSFVDSSIDATNVIWYFGDGDSSLMNNPTHTYAATGDYEVILKAENSTNICVESRDTFMVHIRQIEAQFELPEEGCSGTPLMLDATMSTDVNAECWKGYTWFTSESRPITTQDSVIDFSFGNEGKQWARLVVEDINGCRDTISDTITIFRVVADFTISDDTICSGQTPPVSFTDLSQSLETGNIVEWEWSFGDGSMSTNQNPTYNFPTPPLSGVFQVTLTAKNDKNCPGEITKEIFVYEPFTEIMIPDQDLCVGEEITFSAADFTDYGSFLNYSWSLNGTPLTTSNSGTQQFNTAGTFTLNLTYTEDATGCVGTDSKSIDVQDYPDASFFAESNGVSFDSINCANQNINFTTNNFTSGVSYSWQADGKNFPEIGSGFTYSFNQGTFSVTSIASTTFGCRDTFTDVFTFIGPEGDLELSNSQICAGESVELSLNNQNNVSSFILISGFMGQSSTTSPATFTYPQGGLYGATVEMTYVGMGLNCRAIDTAFVEVIEPNGVLSPLALSYCIGQSVNFSLDSISDADFFYFNFGDGSPTVSTGQTLAEHNYTQPGTYTVEIILEDTETGCTKTIETEVTIEAQKIPVVVAPGSVCGNNEVIFIVNNYIPGERFIWTDPDGNLGSDPDTLGQNLVYTFPAISRNSDYKLNFSTGDCDFDTTFTVEYLDGIGLEGDSLVVLVAEKDEMDFNGTPIPGLPANAANYNIVWTPNRSLDVNDPLNPILTQLPADSLVVVANVTDDAGCDSARFVRLLLVYRIPNVFYPGSAEFEENRVFNVTTVSGLSGSEVLSMRIYNTWGKLVYDNDDPVNGWDGTKDGVDQPSDVYMYQIELQLSDGTKRIIEGDVTLLR